MLPRLANFARDTSGAVAPLFATALIGLVSAGALAWDISRGYAMKAELEAAVDAAALAGATQLDGQSDSITRATTAAEGALVQNSKRMGDTYEANVVGAGDTIQYLTDLTSRTVTTDGADAKFIEITLAPRPMGLILGALVGAGAFNGRAHAVAGYGSALCKVPPMFVCNPDETKTSGLFDAYAGKGLVLNGKGGSGAFTAGNFGFLQVGTALSALQQAMGRSPPLTDCFGETVETKTGDPTSVLPWFNTRFDIYSTTTIAAQKDSPYYAPAEITVTGLAKNTGGSNSVCKPGSSGNTYNGSSSGVSAMAMPRDKCAYSKTTAGANQTPTCDGPSTNSIGTGVWDAVSYFKITHNYTSAISNTTTPTGETWASYYDYPDASTKPTYPTRYQVYLWEKDHKDTSSAWATSTFAAANTKTSDGDWNTRQCGTSDPVAGVPDRRTISAVVLNCSAVGNGKSVKQQDVVGAVDIFLTEPASVNGNGWIYGEIIGSTTDSSAVGQETRVYSVRLYE